MSSATDRLYAVIEPEVAALGMDLEDITLSGSGKTRVLTAIVDKDGGVGVEDIADVSREISDKLDSVDDLGEGAYTLEVTSRGVDRPLTRPRHWKHNRGRLVDIRTHDGESIHGRIRHSDDDKATVDVTGSRRDIAYDDVSRAFIQVEINRKGS